MIIAKGSEAFIYLENDIIIKDRVRKDFIEESLDQKLRKIRTTKEYNILHKLHKNGFNVPKPISKSLFSFKMEYIKGKNPKPNKEIAIFIGNFLKKLHSYNIIHYDLTIFNILETEDKHYVIDFGLSFYSYKIEDKATDLLVSISNLPDYENEILEGYQANSNIIKKIKEIRDRARYTV